MLLRLGRRPVHRGQTMIALRARREAMQITEEIAYPPVLFPPPPPPPPPTRVVVTEWWPDESIYFEPSMDFFEPLPAEPAPAWLKWVLVSGLLTIFIVGFLLGMHAG